MPVSRRRPRVRRAPRFDPTWEKTWDAPGTPATPEYLRDRTPAEIVRELIYARAHVPETIQTLILAISSVQSSTEAILENSIWKFTIPTSPEGHPLLRDKWVVTRTDVSWPATAGETLSRLFATTAERYFHMRGQVVTTTTLEAAKDEIEEAIDNPCFFGLQAEEREIKSLKRLQPARDRFEAIFGGIPGAERERLGLVPVAEPATIVNVSYKDVSTYQEVRRLLFKPTVPGSFDACVALADRIAELRSRYAAGGCKQAEDITEALDKKLEWVKEICYDPSFQALAASLRGGPQIWEGRTFGKTPPPDDVREVLLAKVTDDTSMRECDRLLERIWRLREKYSRGPRAVLALLNDKHRRVQFACKHPERPAVQRFLQRTLLQSGR